MNDNNLIYHQPQNHAINYIERGSAGWSLTYYCEERHVILPLVLKNASSSLEGYFTHGRENGSVYRWKQLEWDSYREIIKSEDNPSIVIFLRDPIERIKSAISMNISIYKGFGLNITADNFKNLKYATDRHVLPQILQIPFFDQDIVTDLDIEFLSWLDIPHSVKPGHFEKQRPNIDIYPDGWPSLIEELKPIDYIKNNDQYKFFWLSENPQRNSITECIHWLGDTQYKVSHRANTARENKRSHPLLSPDLISYFKNYFRHDYELINSVKFINEKD